MICLMVKPNQSFFVYCIQSKEKELFKEKREWRIEQKKKNEKKVFFNSPRYGN